jgi:hypothetical protein
LGELRPAWLGLDREYPDQAVVEGILAAKKGLIDLLDEGGSYLDYDIAAGTLAPDRREARRTAERVLFRAVGGAEPWFAATSHDFLTTWMPKPAEVPRRKKAFILVDYRNIQARPNRVPLILGEKGTAYSAGHYYLSAPPFANLSVSVAESAGGPPVPFLIAWRDLDTGRPVEADGLGRSAAGAEDPWSRALAAIVADPALRPGLPGGPWSLADGRSATAVSPGRYEVLVSRGADWAPVREALELGPGERAERSYAPMRSADAGGPAATVGLPALPAAPKGSGILQVSVRDAELPGRVPFLLRVRDLQTGSELIPGGAPDLDPQMDPSAEAGRPDFDYPYLQNFPGEAKARYYMIPAVSSTVLPAGRYEVSIRRGTEHELLAEKVEVREGRTTSLDPLVARWTDMRARGWWSGEGHMHSRVTGDREAANILDWAVAADVHLVNVLHMGNYDATWFEQRGFGPDFRFGRGDYVVVPGQEDPRSWGGHVVGQNVPELFRDESRYLSYRWVMGRIRESGGVVGAAHVLSKASIQGDRIAALYGPLGLVDYFEVLQVGKLDTDLWFDALDMGMRLAPGSGTDIPWHGSIGEGRMYANLGGEAFSPEAWYAAVRAGRVFVSNGPMIALEVEGKGPGEELALEADRKVRVRARAWSRGGSQSLSSLELVARSAVVGQARPAPGVAEASLSLELPSAGGVWVLVRARTTDGGLAVSSPVYISVAGGGTATKSRLPELSARYVAFMDSLAADLAGYKDRYARGQIPAVDGQSTALGRNADTLIAEVEEVRAFYAGLGK